MQEVLHEGPLMILGMKKKLLQLLTRKKNLELCSQLRRQANGGAAGNQLLVWEQLQEPAEKTKSQNRGVFLWYQHIELKIHQQF